MRRDLLRIHYEFRTTDPREAIDMAVDRVREGFPEDDESPTVFRIDSVQTKALPPDSQVVRLNVAIAQFLAAHDDPREMVDIVLEGAEVEYASRLLTLLSKWGRLGPNDYTDEFRERHADELRRRGY